MERLVLWHRLIPSADEPDAKRTDRWTRAVLRAVRDARGTLLCTVGSTVSAAFDVIDLDEVVELALSLAEAAEREEPALAISLSVAAGELAESTDDPGFPFPVGSVIDRAQVLANRAREGEVVLDRAARALADRTYLFGRPVGLVGTGVRGEALDREHPRRAQCRRWIRALRASPIPPGTLRATAQVHAALPSGGRHRILLRGRGGAGAREWLDALERREDPALVLRIEAVPGGLEPLGGLRLSLLRRWGTAEGLAAAATAAAVERRSIDVLTRVAQGRAVERAPTVQALRSLLMAHGDEGRGVWIVVDPLAAVDPATLDAVASATAPGGAEAVVFARLDEDEQAPAGLVEDAVVHEVILPPLTTADACAVARGVLGEQTAQQIVERVASLGGDTPLGVVEAARTLVAAGDLVPDSEGWRWRRSARAGVKAVAIESLLEERLGTVEPTMLRVLEAVCVAPSGASNAVVTEVTKADGLDAATLAAEVARLRDEALLRPDDPWQPTSALLRHVILQTMQPARHAELNRFVAEATLRTSHHEAELAKATAGWYLAEGGRERDGARALIEAGRAAQLSGFTRAALKLAAAAVQIDGSEQTRAAAGTLTRAARRPPVPPTPAEARKAPPPPTTVVAPAEDADDANGLAARVIRGILTRDFEAADRYIDIAVAEGRDRGAAERVRALGLLARGDLPSAMRCLARARALAADERAEARSALAHALVLLYVGDLGGAVRAGLASLAKSRARRDPRGEAAALHALAMCYRGLGREKDAELIEEASPG